MRIYIDCFVAAFLIVMSSACSYHNAQVDFRALEKSGVFISGAPDLPEAVRSFGNLDVNERAFYFSSCSQTARAAINRLLQEARARGGTVVTNVQFRNRGRWSTNPKCRRNLNWAWLIIPMFLPIPQSVRVRGEVIYDPKFIY